MNVLSGVRMTRPPIHACGQVQRAGPDLTVYAHGFAWDPALEVRGRPSRAAA
jgi:hypothetical protein